MKKLATATSVVALLIASHGVASAQVSANGARDVQTTFETYFGKGGEGGSAVRVTANAANDGYDVSIDIARLAKPLELAGLTVKPALLGFAIKPTANGTWAYSQSTFPTLSVSGHGTTFEYAINGLAASGEYDPKIAAFKTFETTAKSVVSKQEEAKSKVNAETQDIKVTGTSTDAGGNLVDSKISYTTGSIAQTIVSAEFGNAPIRISLANSAVNGRVTGQAAKGALDLWAFFVAHPSKETIIADEAALKAKLTAALPVFKNVDVDAAGNNLVVETPLGNVRVAKLGLIEKANGIVPEGLLEFGLTFGAIEPPAGVVPGWATPLIPKDSGLGFRVTGYNADALARAAIAKLDLKAPEPLNLEADEVTKLLLPSGKVLVDILPGKLINDTYNISWSGKVEVDPNAFMASGKATITAKGLDKIAQILSKQTDTVQFATILFAAKAMAKQANGADVWELEFDSTGKLLVNGQKLGG